jgi:hypothetical protein
MTAVSWMSALIVVGLVILEIMRHMRNKATQEAA